MEKSSDLCESTDWADFARVYFRDWLNIKNFPKFRKKQKVSRVFFYELVKM